jgi:hypothetical protein
VERDDEINDTNRYVSGRRVKIAAGIEQSIRRSGSKRPSNRGATSSRCTTGAVTEAQKVAREVEYDLWFVAHDARRDARMRYTRKSHVFTLFEMTMRVEAASWRQDASTARAVGCGVFAKGDETLPRTCGGAGDTGRFNSSTLAHETTTRWWRGVFPGKRWPLWYERRLRRNTWAAPALPRARGSR